MARFKLKEGDVFTIPLVDEEVGFGQIVAFPHSRHGFIMCVFDYKQTKDKNWLLSEICRNPIILLGYSTDAKLYHADWEIIGNNDENLPSVHLPYHKLGTPPNDIYIVDFKGEKQTRIDSMTFDKLNYETSVAPIRFENALKAYYGFSEWKENYDILLYQRTIESVEIAKNTSSQ